MPEHATEILRVDLLNHPAVKAWGEVQPGRLGPKSIEILQQHRKSAVYRLEGAGPGGSTIIAKRCQSATARIERAIYEQVLPCLPISAPQYYGFMEEDDKYCWLFLEDVGRQRFSPLIEEHRRVVGRWLALMHTSAARVAAKVRLPDRGPNHYLEHLQSARRAILYNLANPALTADDVALLETIVSQYNVLEWHWSELEKWCERMPPTLAHGDFRPKNIYLRADQASIGVFPLDWEMAGWGVPAADLAPARGLHSAHQVNLMVYGSIVRDHWPSLDIQTIQRLASVGTIFRRLAAISWESPVLTFDDCETLSEPLACLRVYQAELSEAIQLIPWAQ